MGAAWGGGTVNLSRPRCACIYIYLRKLQAKIAIDAHCSVHVCCRKCVVQDCKSETCDCWWSKLGSVWIWIRSGFTVPSSPATHRFLAIRIQCNTLLEFVLAIIVMQTHAGGGRDAKHNVSENRLQQPSMSAMQCTPKRSSLCNVHFCRPTISRSQHPSSSRAANYTTTTTCMETNTCTCMLVYICIVYICVLFINI